MTGELEKVTIRGFKKKDFSDEVGKFILPINPEQYSQQFKISYDKKQAQGAQGNDPKYQYSVPTDLSLNFTFDGTGVVPVKDSPGEFHKDVKQQIDDFLGVVYYMEGSTHKPNYLKLVWGDLSFDCLLTELSINYTLFSSDGKPLRAKLSAKFVDYKEQAKRVREEGKNSPDITHTRKVQGGDHLPMMTNRIYGDPSYYLEVARVNNLDNFRRLRTNTDLIFPPIDKTSK